MKFKKIRSFLSGFGSHIVYYGGFIMSTGGTDNIFLSCRKGNLDRIRYLVEKKEINLNVRDCWDSTPLYYACHCGHTEVVKYLLAHGARCEEKTFDGERCLYGALTDDIRLILLESKVADFETQKLDDFDEFCKKLLAAKQYSDITLRLNGGRLFHLHRCILAARSPGLNTLLVGKWKDLKEVSNNIIDPNVFEAFVKYLYTGKLKLTRDDYDETIRLANQSKVQYLIPLLEHTLLQSKSFEGSKKNIKVTTLLLDTTTTREILEDDFSGIIEREMEDVFAQKPLFRINYFAEEDEDVEVERKAYHDICIKVDQALFFCNKVFLFTRSEYFAALFQDHFNECREFCNGIPVITMRDITPQVFCCILYYMYSNKPHNLTEEIVHDVMEASDMYLLPGLTKICGNFLCKTIYFDNAVDLLLTSRLRNLPKLEASCVEFIGEHLDYFCSNEQFRAFVVQDAKEVVGRQETDSIPIIDDIRYYITTSKDRYMWYSNDESCQNLRLIDDLLEDLDLEA